MRTVLTAPVYQGEAHLERAVRSLLAQTVRDFRLLLVDDASSDGTVALARALAAEDPRIEVHVNATRLGMLGNTQRAWALARERHPEAEFVALASDHDVWAPDWLEALIAALEASPGAVLAYPQSARIDATGALIPGLRTWRCETTGEPDPYRRLRRAYRCMVAGDMIYGLMRADAFARAGGTYRAVLVPDRLLLSRLALEGEFAQVPRVLWHRRFVGLADLDRQRRAFWPAGDVPASARRYPWWVTHAVLAAREGDRRLALELALAGARLRALRRLQALRRAVGRRLERPVRAAFALGPVRAIVDGRRLPIPADTQAVLERLLAEHRSGQP
jgi:glycosyltransferase involved in cell wall biosynthesis